MRRLMLVVALILIAAAAALLAAKAFRHRPAPAPLTPATSPTPAGIASLGDLYAAEQRLNTADIDGPTNTAYVKLAEQLTKP